MSAEVHKLCYEMTSAPLSRRRELLEQMESKLKQGLPGAAITAILHEIFPVACARCTDFKSRRLIARFFQALVIAHPQSLTIILREIISTLSGFPPGGRTVAHYALGLFTWLRHAVQSVNPESLTEETMLALMDALVEIARVCACSDCRKIHRASYRKFRNLFIRVPNLFTLCESLLKKDAHFQRVEALPFLCWMFNFAKEKKVEDVIAVIRKVAFLIYTDCILASKTKVSLDYAKAGSDFVRTVSSQEFGDVLLPAMQKYLLRSPEVVIEAVAALLGQLTIDLSAFGPDLLKSIAAQLCSKEDEFRAHAVAAVRSLAKQCGDHDAIASMLHHLFSVLNGHVQGKLALATQRQAVLQAIGALAEHTVSGLQPVESLSQSAVDLFVPVLKEEINEHTLLFAVEAFCLWSTRFKQTVPSTVATAFKDGLANKQWTPAVRLVALRCMNTVYQGNTLGGLHALVQDLVSVVDKALKQQTQLPLRQEALAAALALLRLLHMDPSVEGKISGHFWSAINVSKPLFCSRPFLESLSDEMCTLLVTYLEQILLYFIDRLDKHSVTNHRDMLLFVLLYQSYANRVAAKKVLRRLLDLMDGAATAKLLLELLDAIFRNYKPNLRETDEEVKEKVLTPRLAHDTLLLCISVTGLPKEAASQLALAAFPAANSCVVVEHDNQCWSTVLQQLAIQDKATFVLEHLNPLLELCFAEQSLEFAQNAAGMLTEVGGPKVLARLLELSGPLFRQNALFTVTAEDYEIYRTPEGLLHNRELLDALLKESSQIQTANIKRESKMYSYKEQIAELQLRKELQAKKGGPSLTDKQKDQLQQELTKESATRKRLTELRELVVKRLMLVEACALRSTEAVKRNLVDMLDMLMPLAAARLVSDCLEKCWTSVALADLFDKQNQFLAVAIGHASLRFLGAFDHNVSANWTKESNWHTTVQSLLTQLIEISRKKPLSPPSFAFCFPFLRSILTSDAKQLATLKELAIALMEDAIKEGAKDSDYGMEQLPVESITATLLNLVGSTVRESQVAGRCLVLLTRSLGPLSAYRFGKTLALLMAALLHPSDGVREVVLRAIHEGGQDLNRVHLPETQRRIWVARYDPSEYNREIANNIWMESQFTVGPDMLMSLMPDIVHDVADVRTAAANAMSDAAKLSPQQIPSLLTKLVDMYKSRLKPRPPTYDSFGRLLDEGGRDEWEARAGIALTLEKLSAVMPATQLPAVFQALFPDALGDKNEAVRQQLVAAASEGIKLHGKAQVQTLLPMFENWLNGLPDSAACDQQRQCLVILLGTLAQHLDTDDQRVRPIVARLIETLSTPSQAVQEAVAQCLPQLVPAIKDQAEPLIKKLLFLLFDAEAYGERRGAAYGLAGIIKGLGMMALKEHDVMNTITSNMQDKKSAKHREGALFGLEMLCTVLGKLFEVYVVQSMQHLLLCFGDPDQHVREAAHECSKAVMANLSAHGVKLVLPALLTALSEDSWRTKAASVELLGQMAHCAPQQLGSCLPQIVPFLIETLSDTHAKVHKAGEDALREIGKVVKNPEVQIILPDLMAGLLDPSNKTAFSLQAVLRTTFQHFLDAPSLALIMPVVQRAFDDRSTETRRMAAQVMGSIYVLADGKDIDPYLPKVLPSLQSVLLDPAPDVRGVAAKALGAMVRGLGDTAWQKLVPWLKEHLVSEGSTVDRSGAAQGLSEVLGALGDAKLDEMMQEIVDASESSNVYVRDGYLMLYIYLPPVFGDRFLEYVPSIIPSILKALADESEFVRDTALKGGQRLISQFCESAIDLLLPQLENGLINDNWRIRYSSVQLLGDLLFNIIGVTGKMSTEGGEDDTFGTESSAKQILNALGEQRRNHVLAGLYMCRCDIALQVRQAANHTWKVVVSNTPRTLKETLPMLFQLLLSCLASPSYDRQQSAARTLGDLVRKMGDRILVDIVPVLEEGLKSPEPEQRQGVCIALSEIMNNTSKEMILMYAEMLVPTVRIALTDELPDVRLAAARTFDVLLQAVGQQALDDVLQPLLNRLDEPIVGDYILDGLEKIVALRTRQPLLYLVPKLIGPPVNSKALARLAAVAGDALSRQLHRILPALIESATLSIGTAREAEEIAQCMTVLLAVEDDAGIQGVLEILLKGTTENDMNAKLAAAILLAQFTQQSKHSLTSHVTQLIRGTLSMYRDSADRVLECAAEALIATLKPLDSKQQFDAVADIRRAVRDVAGSLKELPGCCTAKGVQPLLGLLREVVLNGPAELKEAAALGLSEVVTLSSVSALKPHVVNVTGPLIRVLGDRYPPPVKVAILGTLGLLLDRISAMLRPFLPQLQSTFVKALGDPASRAIRLKASVALANLVAIQPKHDQLVNEQLNCVKNNEDASVKETYLVCLRGLLERVGAKLSAELSQQTALCLLSTLGHQDDACRVAAGAAFGVLCAACVPEDQLESLAREHLFSTDLTVDWQLRHGRAVALQAALCFAPDRLMKISEERLPKTLVAQIGADRTVVVMCGLRSTTCFLRAQQAAGEQLSPTLTQALARAINHNSNDVKQLSAYLMHHLGLSTTSLEMPALKVLVPMLVNGTKEKNSGVRCACEEALVAVLQLRQTNAPLYQAYVNQSDPAMSGGLTELYSKTLQKLAKQPEQNLPPIDDTLQV